MIRLWLTVPAGMYVCSPGRQGKSMYDAHHGLHLTDEHFNAVAECFVSTLKELGVESDLIDDAVKVVASTHDEVVGH